MHHGHHDHDQNNFEYHDKTKLDKTHIHARCVPSPVPLLAIDGARLPQTILWVSHLRGTGSELCSRPGQGSGLWWMWHLSWVLWPSLWYLGPLAFWINGRNIACKMTALGGCVPLDDIDEELFSSSQELGYVEHTCLSPGAQSTSHCRRRNPFLRNWKFEWFHFRMRWRRGWHGFKWWRGGIQWWWWWWWWWSSEMIFHPLTVLGSLQGCAPVWK